MICRKRKILYVSGSRADYGLTREGLRVIKNHPNLDLEIAACGMHLMGAYGNTIQEIRQDGFLVHLIDAVFEDDSPQAVVSFIGQCMTLLAERAKEVQPDILLL